MQKHERQKARIKTQKTMANNKFKAQFKATNN